jgi:hypothetical protein
MRQLKVKPKVARRAAIMTGFAIALYFQSETVEGAQSPSVVAFWAMTNRSI